MTHRTTWIKKLLAAWISLATTTAFSATWDTQKSCRLFDSSRGENYEPRTDLPDAGMMFGAPASKEWLRHAFELTFRRPMPENGVFPTEVAYLYPLLVPTLLTHQIEIPLGASDITGNSTGYIRFEHTVPPASDSARPELIAVFHLADPAADRAIPVVQARLHQAWGYPTVQVDKEGNLFLKVLLEYASNSSHARLLPTDIIWKADVRRQRDVISLPFSELAYALKGGASHPMLSNQHTHLYVNESNQWTYPNPKFINRSFLTERNDRTSGDVTYPYYHLDPDQKLSVTHLNFEYHQSIRIHAVSMEFKQHLDSQLQQHAKEATSPDAFSLAPLLK